MYVFWFLGGGGSLPRAGERGWRASAFGAGEAIAIDVYAHAKVEITAHQEAHVDRGAGSFDTLVDLGVIVLKVRCVRSIDSLLAIRAISRTVRRS